MSLKATLRFDDVNLVLRDTILALDGRERFKLSEVESASKDRRFDAMTDTAERIVRALVKTGAAEETPEGFIKLRGARVLLGDDLGDVQVEVIDSDVDHGAFSPNNVTYRLAVFFPTSTLEQAW
jgi:hypothetical protein